MPTAKQVRSIPVRNTSRFITGNSIEVKIGIHHENGLFVVFESEILTVFVRSGSYLGENIPDRFHEFHTGLRFQSILKRCKEIARGTSV